MTHEIIISDIDKLQGEPCVESFDGIMNLKPKTPVVLQNKQDSNSVPLSNNEPTVSSSTKNSSGE